MKIAFINTANTLELFYQGKSHSIIKSDYRYPEIVKAISSNDEDSLKILLGNIRDVMEQIKIKNPGLYTETDEDGVTRVTWNDTELHGTMVDRLIENEEMGLPADGIFNFITRVMESGNKVLEEELYQFLEVGRLPITEEGTFFAYKVVRPDYKDKHSGTMDNSPGTVVQIDRSGVDPDRHRTCSHGLHFCSFEYLSAFYSPGDRVVKVEVAPEDVVAIPSDYNNTKARCCRYVVVEDVTDEVKVTDKETDILRVNGKNITDIVDRDQLRAAVMTLRQVARHIEESEDEDHGYVFSAISDIDDALQKAHGLPDYDEDSFEGRDEGSDEDEQGDEFGW